MPDESDQTREDVCDDCGCKMRYVEKEGDLQHGPVITEWVCPSCSPEPQR